MASRRDELNAYSFARKRTNAAFLKPLPNGSIESAPKPLKAVVPGIVVSVLILVGFGACGIIKPVAPQGWDDVGGNVLVGDPSTTRYVVLNDQDANGKDRKLLHPVLNLASARLLLDPNKFQVVKVTEEQLDGKISHGPAIGIPFAPDRLPAKEDVDKPKTWAVCNRPGSSSGSKPQQSVFVLGGKDKEQFDKSPGVLDLHQALYVQDPEGKKYLVDEKGMKFEFDATMMGRRPMSKSAADQANEDLRRAVFHGRSPQQVTDQWLNTLIPSPIPIFEPPVEGVGTTTTAPPNAVPDQYRTVGTVVQDSSTSQKYVVTKTDVEQVSDFIANMLVNGENAKKLDPTHSGKELKVPSLSSARIHPAPDEDNNSRYKDFHGKFYGYDNPWPIEDVEMANYFKEASQTGGPAVPTDNGVTCNFYKGTNSKFPGSDKLGYPNGVPDMGTWVGDKYPAETPSGSTAYVTPGSGQLYMEVNNAKQKPSDGSMYLVTDTGLRYPVPINNDGGNKAGKADQEVGQNQAHLGYAGAKVPAILKDWSQLLSSGPSLNMEAAEQPQGS